jgi:hypothetical protein
MPKGSPLNLIISNTIRGIVPEEDIVALELILMRLNSVKTTIQVHQFFPRAYFSSRFSVERTFDVENVETYTQLRDFAKKYGFATEEPSWAAHTAFEVDTFQNYDAPDFRRYLALKVAFDEKSSTTTNGTSQNSSESTLPTSPGAVSPVNDGCKESISRAAKENKKGNEYPVFCKYSASEGKGKATARQQSGPTCEDQVSVSSNKSSKMKTKFKAVFTFGSKRKHSSSASNGKVKGRTEALSSKHNGVLEAGS